MDQLERAKLLADQRLEACERLRVSTLGNLRKVWSVLRGVEPEAIPVELPLTWDDIIREVVRHKMDADGALKAMTAAGFGGPSLTGAVQKLLRSRP